MLASTLVHEASHFNHGPDEAAAYEAQITFLRPAPTSKLR
jgi:hypothetical protein